MHFAINSRKKSHLFTFIGISLLLLTISVHGNSNGKEAQATDFEDLNPASNSISSGTVDVSILKLIQNSDYNPSQPNSSSEITLAAINENNSADSNLTLSGRTRRKRSNWESFLLAHTLNPADPRNSNYQYWTNRDWNYWARRREPLHDYSNNYKGQPLTKKRLNAVVIASPAEVEDSFTGRLIYYGYDDLYWSNRKFHTYILRRYDSSATSALDVYDCGYMFFAAHLVRGRPVHFQTGFPSEYDYPFVSDLNFNLKRHCYRVPTENDRDRELDTGRDTYYPGYDRHLNSNRPQIRFYTFD